MGAADVVQTLLQSAETIKNEYQKAQKNNAGVDWKTFLTDPTTNQAANAAIQTIQTLVANGSKENALDEIHTKEQALLNNRAIADLPEAEAVTYGNLVDMEEILVRQEISDIGSGWQIAQAFATNVLPLLEKIVPLVLPLL
jgi:hypothetical protein